MCLVKPVSLTLNPDKVEPLDIIYYQFHFVLHTFIGHYNGLLGAVQ